MDFYAHYRTEFLFDTSLFSSKMGGSEPATSHPGCQVRGIGNVKNWLARRTGAAATLAMNFRARKNASFAAATLLAFSLIPGLSSAPAEAGPVTITIQGPIQTPEEFTRFRDGVAQSPEGGAAVFILAMMSYVRSEKLGEQCFTIALDRTQLAKSTSGGYKGYRPARAFEYFSRRLGGHPYLPFAYVVGTSPASGYRAAPPYRVSLSRNRYSTQRNGDVKVFVETSGGVRPRPVTLRKNDRGHWKVVESSSLFVGLTPPKKASEDEL